MKPTVQKENFPAKQPHTTWSQEPKHSLGQAKVASVPLKSILKNPTSSYMPPASKTPSEPVHDPLASRAFFMSPAETLLESTGPNADDISFHDLIEAYNTFSLRIRSQIRVILKNAGTPPPALISLKECADQMSEALRRDLKRTREEPSSNSRRTSFAQDSLQTIPEIDEEEIRAARDLALLSQQVLRFLSDIFSFPPLYSIFSSTSTSMSARHAFNLLAIPANDLRSILSELLVLGSAPCIPGPASRRTWTFVVWILSVQNLPSEVLLPAKREIVSVLKRALEGQIGKDQAKSDGLQVVELL
jgi:hypothetical protein